MKILFTTVLLVINTNNGIGKNARYQDKQGIEPLQYITSLPIKTEDGCSFFSDSEASLHKKNYILNINGQHVAYIQLDKFVFAYFNRVKRVNHANGYTDYYKGKTGDFKLTINSIKKEDNYTTKRDGIMYLRLGKLNKTIPVCGIVQDNDRINKKMFGF